MVPSRPSRSPLQRPQSRNDPELGHCWNSKGCSVDSWVTMPSSAIGMFNLTAVPTIVRLFDRAANDTTAIAAYRYSDSSLVRYSWNLPKLSSLVRIRLRHPWAGVQQFPLLWVSVPNSLEDSSGSIFYWHTQDLIALTSGYGNTDVAMCHSTSPATAVADWAPCYYSTTTGNSCTSCSATDFRSAQIADAIRVLR